VGVRELQQLPGPRSDGAQTVCLACGLPFGDAPQACTCSPGHRSQAVAILHQELVAGRDPEPALQAWRATGVLPKCTPPLVTPRNDS